MRSWIRTVGFVPAMACVPGPVATCDPRVAAPWAPEPPEVASPEPVGVAPNILLVIMDDVGPELVSTYGYADDAAPTPTLDALADEGLVFTRAYAQPWCSPTRANVLTGRHSLHYRMGRAIEPWREDVSLPEEEVTLPELLDDASGADWSTALFGKWHLTTFADDGLLGPLLHGFDHHIGTAANLNDTHAYDLRSQTFTAWERVEDGVPGRTRGYLTTDTVDDALSWISRQPVDRPWFTWVGLHAAHTPWHFPPPSLHGYDPEVRDDTPTRVRAMVESIDTELGRLLDGLDPATRARTLVVVMGDNGSTDNSHTGRLQGLPGKSTTTETGVRVPLLIAGPGVAGPARVDALVQATDLFATLAEVGGVDLGAQALRLDAVSLVPYFQDPSLPSLRQWVYVDSFNGNGADPAATFDRAVIGDRYKLRRYEERSPTLHDLSMDWLDGVDLYRRGLTREEEDEAAWLDAVRAACAADAGL